jgi:hypothetical protein
MTSPENPAPIMRKSQLREDMWAEYVDGEILKL